MMGFFMSNLEKIDHYVVMLSNHNVAELKSCLQFKPKHLHIISSTFTDNIPPNRNKSVAQRFKDTLEECTDTKNIQLHFIENIGASTLKAENTDDIEQWIKTVFKPYSEKNFLVNPNENIVLNITGGTKPLAMYMVQAYDWNQVHYLSFQQADKQEYISVLSYKDFRLKSNSIILYNQTMDLLDHLKLYADNIYTSSENPIIKHSDSLAIAELRFEGQHLPTFTGENFFPLITALLNDLWYGKTARELQKQYDKIRAENEELKKNGQSPQKNEKKKYHEINLNDFLTESNAIEYKEAFKSFLQRLYALSPYVRENFKITNDIIQIPTHYHNNDKVQAWKKWISGEWFEQLIKAWLIEFGVNSQNLRTGLRPANAGATGRETDILLLKGSYLNFLELKADVRLEDLADISKQSDSQSKNLGLVKQTVILSSEYKDIESEQQFIDWRKNANASDIDIILIKNKEQFKEELIANKLVDKPKE